MSIVFNNTYIDGYIIEDPIVETIYIIISYIKEGNYLEAYRIMNQYNISLENIVSKTQKLKTNNLISFADYLISNK